MNDRILGALKAVGITDAPLASLDHEQQFFALTPQLLLFHSAEVSSPLQQVTLRDISRIHSDHQGTLRVETSGGTSITASLLGFDPNRVQRFFQTVRDTTARAKQQPSSPLPGVSSNSASSKMFAPSTPAAAPSAGPAPSAPASNSAAPRPAEPIILGDPQRPAAKTQDIPTAPESGPKVVKISGSPAPSAPPAPAPGSAPPSSTIRIEARPPVSVNAATTLNMPAPSQPKPSAPALSTSTPSTSKPSAPLPSAASKADAPKPVSTVPTPSPVPTAPQASAKAAEQANRLARAARSLGAQRWTLRILALVLVLGALGVGYVLWQQGKASQLPALWTVTIGIVTAVALLVMAEILKVLSLLGQVVSERGSGSAGD